MKRIQESNEYFLIFLFVFFFSFLLFSFCVMGYNEVGYTVMDNRSSNNDYLPPSGFFSFFFSIYPYLTEKECDGCIKYKQWWWWSTAYGSSHDHRNKNLVQRDEESWQRCLLKGPKGQLEGNRNGSEVERGRYIYMYRQTHINRLWESESNSPTMI